MMFCFPWCHLPSVVKIVHLYSVNANSYMYENFFYDKNISAYHSSPILYTNRILSVCPTAIFVPSGENDSPLTI